MSSDESFSDKVETRCGIFKIELAIITNVNRRKNVNNNTRISSLSTSQQVTSRER